MCLGGKGCDKACLGCLLDFRNKDEHDRFDRRQGLRLLRFILHGHPPTIETGSNDVGDEEMERIVRMIQQPLEMLQDPDIVLTHSEGSLDISKEGRRIRIRPRIPYVDLFEDPILSKWMDEDVMFEKFDENIPCSQGSTTHAEISLSYLERNPSNFAEAIHRIMNPGYL